MLVVPIAFYVAAAPATDWPSINLPSPRQVELSGPVGTELRRGLERLAQPPYTTDWLLSDVPFKLDGDQVFAQADKDLRAGTVGFRVTGPPEQGLFRNISLHQLD